MRIKTHTQLKERGKDALINLGYFSHEASNLKNIFRKMRLRKYHHRTGPCLRKRISSRLTMQVTGHAMLKNYYYLE